MDWMKSKELLLPTREGGSQAKIVDDSQIAQFQNNWVLGLGVSFVRKEYLINSKQITITGLTRHKSQIGRLS